MKTAAVAVLLVFQLVGAGVSRQTVKVPMRDGVLLATDIYNADEARPAPVLLCRTPYNKDGQQKLAEKYADRGYVVVVQDCRGRYASGGDYTPYNDDRQDGYDTIEWINRQPWSDGRAGMFGSSHLGLVQWLAMAEGAPGLVAIAPGFTASSLYRIAYRDGALRLALISAGGTRASPPPPSKTLPAEINFLHYHLPLMHLPLASLEEAFGWSLPWMTSILEHPRMDGFWRQTSAEQDIAGSDLPVQLVTGYYDFFHHETVQDFFRLRARPSKAPVQLILGPWTHGGSSRTKTQDYDFGPNARLDIAGANVEWFDAYVKHAAQRAGQPRTLPLVRYFVLGENRWRNADNWPPAESIP
ncbi:MAG: CocE/NonD family hydrolase, partial [Bryobacteraceae bacterium]